jgi:hypothetical protein
MHVLRVRNFILILSFVKREKSYSAPYNNTRLAAYRAGRDLTLFGTYSDTFLRETARLVKTPIRAKCASLFNYSSITH